MYLKKVFTSMCNKGDKDPENVSIGLAIARDSLHNIRRLSEDSLCGVRLDPERAYRLSYLREQFSVNKLDTLFNRYTDRINQAYFSLFLLLQTVLSLSHFILVLVLNTKSNTLNVVILDLIFYSFTGLASIIMLLLNERYGKTQVKIFKVAFLVILLFVFLSDLTIPIYHYFYLLYFRPANITHVIITCYIFSSITSNLLAASIGVIVTLSYLLTLGFVTYYGDPYIWRRLGTDLIYLVCLNGIGVYFRFANELVKRKSFLDHRACIESTLKLNFEKQQEEQLMKSIIPYHIIDEVRKDILKKIKDIEHLFKIPTTDPLAIPFVREHDNVSILYADIVNYTSMTSKLPVKTLVATLNDLFSGFDDASEQLKVLRIKFLGDCYYCVSGLPPDPAPNHGEACVELGLKMISIIRTIRTARNLSIDMRIGIHSGKILGGIIGSAKWQFDIWSRDVYLANIMESTGEAGKVHITSQTFETLKKSEKSYNVVLTNRGSTEEKLVPYNVTTYLISPDVPPDERPPNNNKQPKESKKKLSVIGEAFPTQAPPNLTQKRKSITFIDHLQALQNEDDGVANNSNESNVVRRVSKNYDRRDSLRTQTTPIGTILNRRPSSSNSSAVGKRISGRRYTPRRTAFMDNNINRYHERLEQTDDDMKLAIENMPLTKYEQWVKMKEINPFLLSFKDCEIERKYNKLLDPLYRYYVVIYILLFIATTISQNITLPQWEWDAWLKYGTLLFMLLIVIPMTWMYYLWNEHFDSREDDVKPTNSFVNWCYKISSVMTKNVFLRTTMYLIICCLFVGSILDELIQCKEVTILKNVLYTHRTILQIFFSNDDTIYRNASEEQCIIPWHMSHTLSLAILASFSFLRIHLWIKLFFAAAVTIFYSILVWDLNYKFYELSETYNNNMKPQIAHIMSLAYLTICLHLIDRQNDYLNRLDYQWNETLQTEQINVNIMHKVTKMLLKNILPIHVANLYLDVNRDTNNELYNEEYANVSVMFATVVDFPMDMMKEMYTLQCINRIIKDFDNLLLKERRQLIEKIKVINLTYMAACGLDPGRRESRIEKFGEPTGEHVAVTLVKFAVDMIKATKIFNRGAYLECKLRIGISHGEVMGGVVGSKKPLYDIWGDTVNLASRMDSTGIANKIQVTENTASILQKRGIKCEYRGETLVKGKGNIPTYFVILDDNDDLQYVDTTTTYL